MTRPFRILTAVVLVLVVMVGAVGLAFALGAWLQLPSGVFIVPIAIAVSWLGVPWLIRLYCWAIGMSRAETQEVLDRDPARRGP